MTQKLYHFTVKAGILFLLLQFTLSAQSENHKWKPVELAGKQKLFCDVAIPYTSGDEVISFWLLELHRPAIEIEGIPGKITRTKTLYILNTKAKKYGIRKVVYYNVSSEEIKRYSYEKNVQSPENLCTFPLFPNSPIEMALKVLLP